ncbi:MAG: MarR family transcriptional regulator [Clostridiales bacterium]|nr:MarR family transcriptional regulator [Clostridiales bacterium]
MLSIRNIWLDMKAILRASRRRINEELEPLNLSGAEGDILFHLLTGNDAFRQEQLAELLDIGKAAVSRTVDALEEKGYVLRVRRAEDRRAYSICLTDRGRSLGDRVTGVYERLYALVRQGIEDEDLLRIEALFSRVAANLGAPEERSCCRNG